MTTIDDSNHQRLIQRQWEEEKCPIVNGIIFGDGRIAELSFPTTGLSALQVVKWSDVSAVDEDNWAYMNGLVELPIPDRDLLIQAGEGSWGGEGFVAVSRMADGRLIWIAHFDFSNPFVKVALENERIKAGSTYQDEWYFPLFKPEQVVVDKF